LPLAGSSALEREWLPPTPGKSWQCEYKPQNYAAAVAKMLSQSMKKGYFCAAIMGLTNLCGAIYFKYASGRAAQELRKYQNITRARCRAAGHQGGQKW
jgi:hypothetical protein